MVELPILGMLKESPLHGYELKRRMDKLVGYFGVVSFGSLYPMLRKLEGKGFVSRTIEEDQKGPSRIVYSITSRGDSYFLELMRNPKVQFTLKLLFLQAMAPSERKPVLESQRDEWARSLEAHRQDRIQGMARSAGRYRIASIVRAIKHLENDIAWLQNIIDGEDLPWKDP